MPAKNGAARMYTQTLVAGSAIKTSNARMPTSDFPGRVCKKSAIDGLQGSHEIALIFACYS